MLIDNFMNGCVFCEVGDKRSVENIYNFFAQMTRLTKGTKRDATGSTFLNTIPDPDIGGDITRVAMHTV